MFNMTVSFNGNRQISTYVHSLRVSLCVPAWHCDNDSGQLASYYLYVTGFAKGVFIQVIINTQKYKFEIFHSDQSCPHVFLHKSIKNSQMTSIGTNFTYTCHTKQLNQQSNSSASHVVIHSRVPACQGKIGLLKGHPSDHRHQTGLRKRPE